MAHGTPGSQLPADSVLLGPLRKVDPIGWIGGRYTTSNPIAAMAGSRSAAVRKVPLTGAEPGSTTAPSERGNISYQEPKRARLRSTSSGSAFAEVTSSRYGRRASAASTAGASAAAWRASTVRSSLRIASAAASTASRPSRLGTFAAARS